VEPWQELLTPENPAAGSDFVYTVGGENRIVVVSVMCELATSAVVGNRGLSLQFRNGNQRRFLVAGTAATVPESTTQAFCWQASAGAGVWAVDDAALAGIPEVMLMPTWSVTAHITGRDAGDQLKNLSVLVERYPTDDTKAGDPDAPILALLREFKVDELIGQMRGLRRDLRDTAEALGVSVVESRRARLQREALAPGRWLA
jgi:hypothetical protein